MNLSLSFSKYSTFEKCPLKYIYQYVIKPPTPEEPPSYPLILGKLTHLFIELYHNYDMDVNTIRLLSDNLNKLHDYINLVYLAYDFKSGSFASQTMDISGKTEQDISYIKDNMVVFFHAFKMFKGYLEKVYNKFKTANLECEFTFNNVYKLGDNNVCMYGSIDLIFFLLAQQLKYIYLSDFKTGKTIDEYAILQLYFYYYNLINYDFNNQIVNNPDKINKIKQISEILADSNIPIFGIIFKLREPDQFKKITIDPKGEDYNTFISRMLKTTEEVIIPIHDNKDNIDQDFEKYVNMYSDTVKYCKNGDINKSSESFHCKYCKFTELCNYRIRQ